MVTRLDADFSRDGLHFFKLLSCFLDGEHHPI
jgi:hypothetical protein